MVVAAGHDDSAGGWYRSGLVHSRRALLHYSYVLVPLEELLVFVVLTCLLRTFLDPKGQER